MPSVDARKAIGKVIGDNWKVNNVERTPIAWPNRVFTPPKGKPWIRVTIVEGESRQMTIGDAKNVHRQVGILYMQVFSPADTGDLEARGLADDLAALFRGLEVDGYIDGSTVMEVIRFRSPKVRSVGVEGVYYQVNCEVPFDKDLVA